MIGISLGNKYFTNENIREYILWALENTKEKVLVFIADKIHAVNYQVRWGYEQSQATSVALRKGKEMKEQIASIIDKFPKDKEKIAVIGWEEIENTEKYKKEKAIFEKAFQNNKEFRNRIMEIIESNINPQIIKLKEGDYEKLALYPLYELPIFISGLEFNKTLFNCLPYPKIGKIDQLEIELQNGKTFPEISKQLDIKNKVVIVEAFVVS